MKQNTTFSVVLFFLAIVLATGTLLWAGDQFITIHLSMDDGNGYFGFHEKVPVAVEIRKNLASGPIMIDRGFSDRPIQFDLRVIDPAGRLLTPKRCESYPLSQHAPPLPFKQVKGEPVRVAPCEVLPRGFNRNLHIKDLRVLYPMELPGYYSAQAQLSLMVFSRGDKGICNVDRPLWAGLVQSNVLHFYTPGETEIYIEPLKWSLTWSKTGDQENIKIKIWIKCDMGMVMNDYDWRKGFDFRHIYLNKKIRLKVEPLSQKGNYCFLVPIKAQDAIQGLGEVKPGTSVPVMVTGWLRSGLPFGGGQDITLIP